MNAWLRAFLLDTDVAACQEDGALNNLFEAGRYGFLDRLFVASSSYLSHQ